MSDEDRFADSPVSRRRFFQLSAAVGASLALPGNATASASDEAFTAEYQYVLNHTPEDYAVPTLVTFSSEAGVSAFEALGVGESTHTTTTPTTAAYAQLTTAEAQQVADLPSASEFQFSPGSNPFWRIGYYPLGVFPEPRRSVDYIGFEQLKDGLAELESRYPDRIRVKNVGRSPGHLNRATNREDPKGMYVVELTNFDSETDFEDKEKVFFSCSLHGLEMAARETAARVLENVARSSEKDVIEDEEKVEPYLDEVVVIIGFTNPDGWAVRNPQYDSGWQTGGPGALHPRVPAAPLYERGNAEVFDTNRQYPIEGYLRPSHYPAQPNDPVSENEETPSFVNEKVPDAKAFVDFFSQYENLNYGADLHGGPTFNNFVLGLISQDQFDTRELHEVYEMCLNIDEVLEEALEIWTTAGDLNKEVFGGGGFTIDDGISGNFGFVPTEGFDYATIYDTILYTVSGAFLDWMAHPEPIGLDLTTLDFEMSYNHITGGNVYNPELFRMEVDGYRTVIRTITAFAVNNSDTPGTDDEFATRTETGGESVAFVTTGPVDTDEDALRVTSDDLEFGDGDGSGGSGGGGGSTSLSRQTESVTVDGTLETTYEVTGEDVHSFGVDVEVDRLVADAELVSPDGEVVAEYAGVHEEDDRLGGKDGGVPPMTVSEPQTGTWTFRLTQRVGGAREGGLTFWTLSSSATNPDPKEVFEYKQREYSATPFRFFEDYADFIEDDGTVEAVTVDEVANGALTTASGDPAYDHVVVIHGYGANGDTEPGDGVYGYREADHPEPGFTTPGYTDGLDAFVDAGGNLVLTDAGLKLLPKLENELVDGSAMSTDDVLSASDYEVARFTDKNIDHPLLTDARPIQNQLWKVAPLGYQAFNNAPGQAPMFAVDETALAAAAGDSGVATVAGSNREGVVAGSVTRSETTGTGVHLVGSLLPRATQSNVHAFGLQDYTVTFLGSLMLTSALGFEQVRDTGEEVRTFARGDSWDLSGVEPVEPPAPEFSADGSRSDDGSVFTGGQTNRVEITVETIEGDVSPDTRVTITDEIPDGWSVDPSYGDVEGVEDGVVDLGTVTPGDVEGERSARRYYFAEAPEGAGETGRDTFGPATATATIGDDTVSDQVAGTDTNTVVGPGTET